jgi:hypothetical protein
MAKLNARLLQLEWLFHEKGMDAAWNELRKFAQSTIGNLAGTTVFGDIDLASAVMVTATAGVPNTGAPIPPGANIPGWGGTSFATAPQGPPNVTLQPTQSGGEQSPRPATNNEP